MAPLMTVTPATVTPATVTLGPGVTMTQKESKLGAAFKGLWTLVSGDNMSQPLVAVPYWVGVVFACIAGLKLGGMAGLGIALLLHIAAWFCLSWSLFTMWMK